MKILQIVVDDETSEAVKTLAKSEGLALSADVRRLILQDIDRRKLQLIQELKQYDTST